VTFAQKIEVSFKKPNKTQKNHFKVGFFRRVFWVLLGGFFIANPESKTSEGFLFPYLKHNFFLHQKYRYPVMVSRRHFWKFYDSVFNLARYPAGYPGIFSIRYPAIYSIWPDIRPDILFLIFNLITHTVFIGSKIAGPLATRNKLGHNIDMHHIFVY
jgi:hypothetical protein